MQLSENVFISETDLRNARNANTPSEFVTKFSKGIYGPEKLSKRACRSQVNLTEDKKVFTPETKRVIEKHYTQYLKKKGEGMLQTFENKLNTYSGFAARSCIRSENKKAEAQLRKQDLKNSEKEGEKKKQISEDKKEEADDEEKKQISEDRKYEAGDEEK